MNLPNANSNPDRSNTGWVNGLSSRDESVILDLTNYLKNGLLLGLKGKIDENLAEDFAQDSVLKILGAIETYRGDCLFTTWAMSIAMRTAFSELRRARWKDVSLDSLTQEGTISPFQSGDVNQEDTLALEQLVDKLRHAIDSVLSDRQKMLICAELSGMPQAVLCDRLGTNRNALYKLGHDARVKLKNALQAEGISESEVRCILAATSNR